MSMPIMSRHPCSRTVQCASGQNDPAAGKHLRRKQYVIAYFVYGVPTFMCSQPFDLDLQNHLPTFWPPIFIPPRDYPEQKNAERTYNNQPVEKEHTKLKSQTLNSQAFDTKMSDNNNNSAQQPKQAGGFFGGLSNAAGGLASGVGGVASGTVNTVGGVVGNVGRGVGKTLSDASSGLENTAKGAGGAIGDTTGAKKQPETK
ncbi:hypothetical protein AUEXF2481DRAFT_518253 [Aureobasidium subglaciale EXF-2481]|uniref:Uncharacterized protein n=1 Tax=Aureobasidium subglaciale (strain EXF-2481) TaxID=1043005 RepID=A0A074Y4S9_AURSE|nr:uncharacterized protein AUEXF2481DRAFT_518253 [Aureobasidium subglaciale EXF-2481]KAI5208746.1 hypothetical protein E4T38_02800 [Aureobasidium subglaciale]KAI5227497.1 hypothetical protein E4T40_02376 [Aureobasidium subglaciale]KAI5230893.1 hypothetical protein E4T41_02799 [Aureobasidium subglaciale]KAI5265104.1 hypothetical protein E4T46_02577 [Aureobasidium subglaciale]KEQ90959.1 hypothetical protein AUEXF2481DRAFT_518253 [Aureobasidium subglaciale EXF-2481]